MPECPFAADCPTCSEVNKRLERLQMLLRRRYCHGTPDNCARFLLRNTLGPEDVPRDLLPTDTVRAQRLIQALLRDDATPKEHTVVLPEQALPEQDPVQS